MARFITKTVCMALITLLCAGNVFAQGGTYNIVTLANPTYGGVVYGGGSYAYGEVATICAIPDACYNFIDWTENGVEVSVEMCFTFIVTADRVLTANFEYGRQGYEITVLANPPEGGTVTGGGSFPACDGVATVTAIPNDCYEFVNWTEDGVVLSNDPVYIFTVTKSSTLVANFEQKTHDIITLANPACGGVVVGGGSYLCGEVVTICAIPASCYEFVNWTENGVEVSVEICYTFIVTADRVLTANFEYGRQGYEITVLANPPQGGTVTGGGSFPACGGVATVTAIPNDCYEFVNWTEDDVVLSNDPVYIFTVTKSSTLVANFEFGRQGYEITVLANPPEGGTVTGGGSFPACGGVATVTAIPNDCYEFVNWTEDDVPVSMDTYYTFTVTKNRTLVANFAPKRDGCEVIVLANPPQGGTVTGGGAYDCGDDVTICAIPVPCYEFLYWSEDGVALSTEACFTFTVTGNRTLVANFVLTEYEIIVLANPEDGGDVTGDGAYDCGEEVTVTATPAEGYIFVHWREADMIVSIDAVYSFVVTASRTLIAEFSGTTAIGEVETSGITIYPNPTSGELKVESGEWRVESVEVFDVYGRNVSRLTSHIAHPISIDISFLPSGIYFVRITTENNVVTKKIVKH